jgi:hypothetical protein
MRIPNFALKFLLLLAIFAPYALAYEPLIPPKITVSQTREAQEEIIIRGKALLAWQVQILRTVFGIDKHALEFFAIDKQTNEEYSPHPANR